MKKRLLAFLLVLMILPIATPTTRAEEANTTMGVMFSKIHTLSAAVAPTSGGWMSLSASISTQAGTTTSVSLQITLYRLDGTWVYVDSWSASGGDYADWLASYKGEVGKFYYLKVVGTATGGGSTETESVQTSEKLCR